MDATPDPQLTAQIREVAQKVAGVDAVEKCFARRMGYHLWVDMHVHVNPTMTVLDSHTLAHAVKDSIRAEMPHVYDVLIHIEPSRSGVPPQGLGGAAVRSSNSARPRNTAASS